MAAPGPFFSTVTKPPVWYQSRSYALYLMNRRNLETGQEMEQETDQETEAQQYLPVVMVTVECQPMETGNPERVRISSASPKLEIMASLSSIDLLNFIREGVALVQAMAPFIANGREEAVASVAAGPHAAVIGVPVAPPAPVVTVTTSPAPPPAPPVPDTQS